MKKIFYIIILLFSFFIDSYHFNKIYNDKDCNDKNIKSENTISLEIKTWKYTNDKNFIYYLNYNPHANYKLNANDSIFFNLDLILNNIYTDILVGSPPQNILGFFAGKVNTFKIFYFNKTKSETLNVLSKNGDNIGKCSENFKFICENKIYELKEMEFVKTQYSSLKLSHSFLGLQISAKDKEIMKIYNNENINDDIFNFVESLQRAKSKELNITNYYWTIKFFETEKKSLNGIIDGIFYFGEPPHIFDPINYQKDSFIEINTEAGYDNLYWGLKFDYIDLINQTSGKIITVGKYKDTEYSLIYPELNYFITSENFFARIKRVFFNKFILKKKDKNYNSSLCYEAFVSLVDNINLISFGNNKDLKGIYDTIYCNKKRIYEYGEEKFYNEFPKIKFHHLLLGYDFEFTAKDLFLEKKGNIYFLMAIKLDKGDKWILGKTFIKKYQIVFNNDMRTLGFYLKGNQMNKIIKPKEIINYVDSKRNSNIFVIILFCFIISIIIFCLIRIYCIKKRIWIFKDKRNAKELEMLNKYKYKEIV